MRKITLLAAFFAAYAVQAQHVLFEDDFESYDDFAISDVGDWTLTDVDGSNTYGMQGIQWPNAYQPMAFMVFNSWETQPALSPGSGWEAYSGDKCMTSFAAVNAPNNDWMISPAITLGTSQNLLSFWAKATDPQYGDEKFNVGISTSGTDVNSFTFIDQNLVPDSDWEEFTFDLDNYAGQTVYIAINHVANDQWGFQVDDFKVTAGVLGVDQMAFDGFKQYTVNNTLHLKADNNFSSFELYNALGQKVHNQALSGNSASIELLQFQSGVYIAKVTVEGAEKSFRVLVK
ncbi:MAG TPA: choice-of-anchor J domain-containing protein [Flavobacteriaceae bacterium]|nr:choice-of-anchor J domain-containing protein [Flavobacteriaceae bacterium]